MIDIKEYIYIFATSTKSGTMPIRNSPNVSRRLMSDGRTLSFLGAGKFCVSARNRKWVGNDEEMTDPVVWPDLRAASQYASEYKVKLDKNMFLFGLVEGSFSIWQIKSGMQQRNYGIGPLCNHKEIIRKGDYKCTDSKQGLTHLTCISGKR